MSVIAIINFSGNVGKSTLTNELFRPRMKDYKFFAVESINASGSPEEEKRRASEFNKMYEEILLDYDNAILDIGASNVEDFMSKLNENVGSHEDFDLFIVPIVPDDKQIEDSLKTIEVLNALGVPNNKITVIFNRIENHLALVNEVDDFQIVLDYHKKTKNFVLLEEAAIYKSDVFSRARLHNMSINELANSKEDYRALGKNPELDRAERSKYIKLHTTRGLAININANLDDVFNTINKKFKLI